MTNTLLSNRKYHSHIFCLLITIVSLAVMLRYAGSVSLWYDDLYTISISAKGLSWDQMVSNMMADAHYNPPLFYLFAAFWLRVAPYGTLFLKLPSILFSAAGIYLCGVVARRLKGNSAAVFATIFAAASTFLIFNGADTFRSYGLMFLLVLICMYFYILRIEKNRVLNRYIFIFGALAAVLCYTHYFGILIIASFFICDLVLIAAKKLNARHLLSYLLFAALFLPFFISRLMVLAEQNWTFWADAPDAKSVVLLTQDIVSNYNFIYILFLFGMVMSVIMIFSSYTREYMGMGRKQVYVSVMQVFTVIFVIGAVFVYSRYINPDGSLFIFRYFVSIVPMIVIISAIGVDCVFAILLKSKPAKLAGITIGAVVCVVTLYLGANTLEKVIDNSNTVNEPFEQAMDWIYDQDIAHNPDTLIITDAPERGVLYYITHDGQRPPLNVAFYRNPETNLTEDNYSGWNTIIRFDGHRPAPSATLSLLQKHYTLTETHDMWGVPIQIYQKMQSPE